MKRKIWGTLSIVFVVLLQSFLFVGCDKHQHVYGDWEIQENATCITREIQSRTCECGEKETRFVGVKLSHTMSEWEELTPATCTQSQKLARHCTTCTTQNETKDGVGAIGHNESEWVEVVPATCLEYGIRHKECLVCYEELERDEQVEKLAHIEGDWEIVKDSTCMLTGTKHKKCITCKTITTTETIEKKGHNETDWLTCYNADGSETGYKEKKCLTCGSITIRAKKEYTITFESNGGSVVTSITDFYGKLILKPSNPTKSGFTFKGWYTDNETFENEFFIEAGGMAAKMPIGNTILYAKWELGIDTTFVDNLVTYRNLGNGEYELVDGWLNNINATKYNIVSIADNAFKEWQIGTQYENYPAMFEFTVPASVRIIGKNAFCNALLYKINFEVGSKLETIGDYAFYDNWLDNSVLRLPEGLESIGNSAFATTSVYSAIKTVYLPSSMQSLGTDAFKGQNYLNRIICRTENLGNNEYLKSLSNLCEVRSSNNGVFMQVEDMLFWKSDSENFARLTYYNISGQYTKEIELLSDDMIFSEIITLPQFAYDYVIESYTFYGLSGIHGIIFADNCNVIKIETSAFGKFAKGYGLPITIGDFVSKNYTIYPNFLFSSNLNWNNVELQQDWLYLDNGTGNFNTYCTVSVLGNNVEKVESFLLKLNKSLSIKKDQNSFGVTIDVSLSGKIDAEDYKFCRLLCQSPLLLEEYI